jgi:mono/diheme cytochrome c family protein
MAGSACLLGSTNNRQTGAAAMTRWSRAILAVFLCVATVLAGALAAVATTKDTPPFGKGDLWMPEWMMREPGGPGPMSPTMTARMLRHAEFLNFGVPKAYQNAKSPVTPDKQVIARGRALYLHNCAACHGPDGLGDGDAGQSLSPSPAVLAYMITRPIAVDRYLMWSVSEGGEQFHSEMPAFKDKLGQDEIWDIIAYMRAGFPGVDVEMPEKQ